MTFAARATPTCCRSIPDHAQRVPCAAQHAAATMRVRFGRSFEAQHVCIDVALRESSRPDSCDSRSNSTLTNPFLLHPQKKYLIADEARSLTRQALK
jgi:hypothetical protein